jgi:hypothetical protein
MEDRLARSRACVDDDTVIGQAFLRSDFRHEVEHALGLVRGKLRDFVVAAHVPLGQDEQVCLGLRVDVADRDESLRRGDMLPVAIERAEQTVRRRLRQRESPPP